MSQRKRIGCINELPRGKTNNVVSEQVRHKPACTSTENSQRLEISDLSRRGIVQLYYPSNENNGADQLRSYCEADLRLCFRHADCWFSHEAAQTLVNNYV